MFTSALITSLAQQRSGLVFLLWGKAAGSRGKLIDSDAHRVLYAPHPSPLSARRGFFGCRHFSQANKYLRENGLAPIDWQLPPLEPTAKGPSQLPLDQLSASLAAPSAPAAPLQSATQPAPEPTSSANTDGSIADWAPLRWQEQWEAIKEARADSISPIDYLGCGAIVNGDDGEEAHRFQTLIAIILASRSRDVAVAHAMQRLRFLVQEDGPICLETVGKLDEVLLQAAIGGNSFSVGFPPTKAGYILRTCEALREHHSGRVPHKFDELMKLAGVGPKAAHLALQIIWRRAEGIAVDSHVHRICNRLGWTGVSGPVKSMDTTRRKLEAWLPSNYWMEVHPMLVGFGQGRCFEIAPRCADCPLMLRGLCDGVLGQ